MMLESSGTLSSFANHPTRPNRCFDCFVELFLVNGDIAARDVSRIHLRKRVVYEGQNTFVPINVFVEFVCVGFSTFMDKPISHLPQWLDERDAVCVGGEVDSEPLRVLYPQLPIFAYSTMTIS